MHISYEEFLHIKEMQEAKLIAGESGTWRRIHGAHVVELADAATWLKEGELLFVSGVGLKNVGQELSRIVQSAREKNLAGIVLEIGPYIRQVSQKVIEEADRSSIPVLTIPFSVPVGEVIARIYYLLYNQDNQKKNMERLLNAIVYEDGLKNGKVFYFGFNEKKKHAALYIGMDLVPEIPDENLKKVFDDAVQKEFDGQDPLLYLHIENEIVVIMDYEEREALRELVEAHIAGINRRIGICKKTASIGVGKTFYDVNGIRKSVVESRKAYRILRSCKVTSGARYYEEIGVYQLFFRHQPEELREFVHDTLGPLQEYDETNDSELTETLRVYLESNCNMTQVTERMFVHRNTVKYRVHRIEEILGLELANVNRQFNLRLAYKIIKYLE